MNYVEPNDSASRARAASRSAVQHGVVITTAIARVAFWLVSLILFGPQSLLSVLAAWTFLGAVRDLTFVRVRLAAIDDEATRSHAARRSFLIEVALIVGRCMLAAALGYVLASVQRDASAMLFLLIPCVILWGRETLLTLARAYRTAYLVPLIWLAAAVSGPITVAGQAALGVDATGSAVTGLLAREAISFLGLLVIVLLGKFVPGRRRLGSGAFSTRGDEDDGEPLDLGTLPSAANRFLIENAIHARWRAVQIGSRALAQGVLGPAGAILTRIFFSYRNPTPTLRGKARSARFKFLFYAGLLAALGIAALAAEHLGLLHAVGLLAAGALCRAAALAINITVWDQLSRYNRLATAARR